MSTKEVCEFNLNDTIRVKLTEYGKSIFRAQHKESRTKLPETIQADFEDYLEIEEDEEGYSEWLCWLFFKTVASHFSPVSHISTDIFKDTTVQIKKAV